MAAEPALSAFEGQPPERRLAPMFCINSAKFLPFARFSWQDSLIVLGLVFRMR